MSHHIVFLDNEGIAPSVSIPQLPFPHTWDSYEYTSPDEVVERLKDATIAMTCSVPLRAEQLRQLPKLKMISLALTGTDIVDLDYCHEHGIVVANVPGYASNTVAEHTIAMMFELLRKTSSYHRLMQKLRRGEATRKNIYFDFRIRDVAGKTLGIVGNGAIARRLAELARNLDMQVCLYDNNGKYQGEEYMPLAQLLKRSDVLSLHVPLTDDTRDIIGAAELGQMKPDAIVINTARGGIVNEAALIDALQNETIGGAALDVLVNEPIDPQDPIFQLIDRDNFILNPHVAWSSVDAMQGLIDKALDNIAQFVDGRAPRFVIQKKVCA
ncbi:hydroxypyruvate reductase [Halopseudomonas litoralis]|uniref:Hydroxypyruvate reductase n=1 Tax=Halopseudomonas litoralis TaxID=797277 RepID=A0A1H1QHC5_9GAMM|nr:NAD(P)-dependent oxidoreductase [Halopseudomonas litoralis]SDS22717.1 hydroxypyruvate reductase [Halopseudomonas litoralis]